MHSKLVCCCIDPGEYVDGLKVQQGCVKIYQEFKGLQKHLDVGRHLIKLERESDYDNIIGMWAETCKTVTGDYVQSQISVASSTTESPSVAADSPSLEEGWALKKAKKSARFSERVRSFFAGHILPRRTNR